jgi:hypothetical protein
MLKPTLSLRLVLITTMRDKTGFVAEAHHTTYQTVRFQEGQTGTQLPTSPEITGRSACRRKETSGNEGKNVKDIVRRKKPVGAQVLKLVDPKVALGLAGMKDALVLGPLESLQPPAMGEAVEAADAVKSISYFLFQSCVHLWPLFRQSVFVCSYFILPAIIAFELL